ncbi:WD40 repeat domain-containing protein [Telluribacter sp.]|uniref:WD40 repeat domain-containing protein n=1 Tax=Telluribacter sp. TaxID=1978767 RepID=UPI002E104B2B|nr:WD40 repeat domain-containing protein [Telluribacter sp.]
MRKLALLAGLVAMGTVPAFAQTAPITFNARGLVAVSDADMAASAFIDGKLLRDNAVKDKLATIKFPLQRGGKTFESIIVSNSALTYSKSIAVPKNGGLAYVLDARVSPSDDVTEYKNTMQEFPEGQKLTVVDIVNLSAPKQKFAFAVGKNPTAIDINKNELMVATSEVGKELVFLEVNEDGKPTRLAHLPAQLDSTRIIDLSFHPNGNYLAVTLDQTKEVGLYRIVRDGAGKLKNIEMIGKPFKAGNNPATGKFSADGKHYFVLDTKGTVGKATGEGELMVIEFSLDGSAEHKVVSKTPVGLNPGAFAVNPEGTMIVTANVGKSAQPWTETNAGGGSSLTLLKVGADGAMTKVADYPVNGIMPQSVAFDKDGSNVAVAIYEYLDYGNRTGGIEFYSVAKGDTPALTKQPGRISVERGCHTIRVIP